MQVARHPNRPTTLDYVDLLIHQFIELHGDRRFGDDKAIATLRQRLEATEPRP